MYKNFLIFCTMAGFLFAQTACTETPKTNPEEINIIPVPRTVEMTNGEFTVRDNMLISYSDSLLKPAADYLADMLSRSTGYLFLVQ